MRLFAAFFAAIFFFLLVATLTHNMPKRLSKVRESKKRLSRSEQRQSWLNQSGVSVTPMQFWGISVGITLASMSVVYAITQVFVVSLIPSLLLGALPRTYFAQKRTKAMEERVHSWPDAIRTLIASITSSQSLHQGLKNLATGGPVPLRSVFRKYSQLTQALDQKSALEVVKEDLADPMSDRIIEILIAATEAGPGVVVDILRDLAEATSRDLQLREHIETMQTEQKLNARVVFVLPFMLLIMMVMSTPEIRAYYQSPIGIFVIILGTLILIGGMLIIKKLGKIPMEQRVFTSSYIDSDEDEKAKQFTAENARSNNNDPFGAFS